MHKFKNATGKYAISNVSCRWFGYLLLQHRFGVWDSLCFIVSLSFDDDFNAMGLTIIS
jgi:hypothetical protein